MFSDYIFFDGLLKEVKRDYADKSLLLLVECRDNQEKWLLLQIICTGITFCRIEEHNGNQEILSEPVRVISLPDGKKLVTLDDETVSDPEQTNGRVDLTLNVSGINGVVSATNGTSATVNGNTVSISVNTANSCGSTFTIILK